MIYHVLAVGKELGNGYGHQVQGNCYFWWVMLFGQYFWCVVFDNLILWYNYFLYNFHNDIDDDYDDGKTWKTIL